MKQTKVAANFVQDFSDAEKEQARANIGAAAASDIPAAPVQSDWTETNTSSLAYIQHKPSIPPSPVQANWNETNTSSLAYIRNKPSIPPSPVQSNWNETNTSSLAYIQNKPETSRVQTQYYGDLEPTSVSTLLINSDDPEGYALVKADNISQGHLIAGPYKTLLDSGVPGVGDANTPVYIDSNGTFQSGNSLTAGYRISINPGANNTRVIANTMHDSVVSACLTWDTLANNYDYDYFWGVWRVHVHLKAFSDWANCADAIHIRINHAYASETGKVKLGSYQVQNYYPYRGSSTQNPYVPSNVWWFYDGYDPYTTATIPDQYGFTYHLNASTPDRNMPADQCAHRFLVDSGAPYGDWLELDASVRFMTPNAAPSSNGIYLIMKAKYSYYYV